MKRTSFLLVWALFFGCWNKSFAQPSSPPDLTAYFSAILVEDIQVSKQWYTEILGFDVVLESQIAKGFTILNLKRGNSALELIQLPGALSPAEAIESYHSKTRIKGFFKVGFKVNDLEAWVEFLQKNEVQFNGGVVEDPVSGNPMVIILDPDGNRIQLFEE
ncbi:MAG: VOC family protein [Cytophagales bacterium]|nr:VOC family protein [Cytophagales bacterium]